MNRERSFCFYGILITIIVFLTTIISCETKPTEPKNDNIFDPLNPQTGGDPFKLTGKIAGGGITLEWNRPNFKDLRFYRMYRSEQKLSGYTQKATFEINQTYYVDKNIKNGHSYWYRVTAVSKHDVETKITNTAGVNIKMEPVLVINNGGPYTFAKEVKLTILAASAKQMIISNNSDFSGTSWEKYMTSKNWTLTSGAGQKTVYMKVEYDTSRSTIVHSSIFPQPMNPAFVIISDTTKYAPARDVQLSISVSGNNLQMKICEDSTFIGANWQTYTSAPNFQLSPGEGSKKIYVTFKNDFMIESSIIKDDIILDTTPPIIALTVSPDSGVTAKTNFQFDPTASSDNLAPVTDMQIRFDWSNDGNYNTDWTQLSIVNQKYLIGGGNKTVRMKLKDGAGWEVETTKDIFVNTRPQASFTAQMDDNNYKLYHFDASAASDYEDGKYIEYRWDFDGDDTWDTGWLGEDTVNHEYITYRDYIAKLAIRDQNNLIAISTLNINVFDGTITDIDGNIYQTVKIGAQWWMAENLKVTCYRNGDTIPNITDNLEWRYTNIGSYCAYNNDDRTIATYGLLYNSNVIDDSRKIAPTGWHVPTDEEWKQLEMYLGMSQLNADNIGWRGTDEGNKLKAISGWDSDGNGTNKSGFTALPGGCRHYRNGYYGIGSYGGWWTFSRDAWNRRMHSGNSGIERFNKNWERNNGYSIRCVRD